MERVKKQSQEMQLNTDYFFNILIKIVQQR